jgi:hypothetical protein
MNDELFNEIFDRASILFREYQSKPKGQMISNMDNFDYWLMYVAYGKGFDNGFSDGYEDGTTDAIKLGREI